MVGDKILDIEGTIAAVIGTLNPFSTAVPYLGITKSNYT